MKAEKKTDFSKFTYQDYLNDKKSCKKKMLKLITEFGEKYDLHFQGVCVAFNPGFGDEIQIAEDIIITINE